LLGLQRSGTGKITFFKLKNSMVMMKIGRKRKDKKDRLKGDKSHPKMKGRNSKEINLMN
jgi:hypothetical protein